MKSVDSHHSLIDYLSDKGFDLIGHSNRDQVKVANSALNEVMYLKRLLVGSISLSDDSQPDEQNGREGPESQDQGLQGEEGEGGGGEEEMRYVFFYCHFLFFNKWGRKNNILGVFYCFEF
ncbi:unnamed protein product [Oncorhynchus mykiss]|uniref:Uncharacterized protein n=1 Tax=Oncorhynchus mykiss TaxID=8022 RepID=A0A060Y2Q4_ONCMY|nr:unnamed protein product [Oncorhynchus mykiss]